MPPKALTLSLNLEPQSRDWGVQEGLPERETGTRYRYLSHSLPLFAVNSLNGMPPKKPRGGPERQAVWPDGTDVAAAHKARAAAMKAKEQSYMITYTTSGGTKNTKEIFIAAAKMPVFMERSVTKSDKARASQRPSRQARDLGHKNVRDCPDLIPGGFAGNTDSWDGPDDMPDEARLEDSGWLPGPIKRDLPPFDLGIDSNGEPRKPGPADPLLNEKSGPEEIMERLLTDDLCDDMAAYLVSHATYYRKSKKLTSRAALKASKDFVEQAWGWSLDGAKHASGRLLVRVWIAARLSVAQLAPEINAEVLWDPTDSLYDQKLDEVLPYKIYCWCNRHMSFAAFEEPATRAAGNETERKDRERKRRVIIDKIVDIIGKAYIAGQMVGLDEKCRPHKHWYRQRIDFKASIHSGSLDDSLNDCVTGYCLWFEERGWQKWPNRDKSKEEIEALGTMPAVMKRATAGLDKSVARIMHLDRGYGHVEAQKSIAPNPSAPAGQRGGVYTMSVMDADRIGLPRQAIKQVSEALRCENKCDHKHDAQDCHKWMWTCFHKGEWELQLWMDSKLMICLSNAYSGTRAAYLSRGIGAENFKVWSPEAHHSYTVYGRSATDRHDQVRPSDFTEILTSLIHSSLIHTYTHSSHHGCQDQKKMAMAARRTVRNGVKGGLFGFDILFTNGKCMWVDLQRDSLTVAQLNHKITKVNFCRIWKSRIIEKASARKYYVVLACNFLSSCLQIQPRCRRDAAEMPRCGLTHRDCASTGAERVVPLQVQRAHEPVHAA